MAGLRQRPRRRAVGPVFCALVFAGCLSPTVHQPGAARRRPSSPLSAAPHRVESATARRGHVVPTPQMGYPTLPKPPRPYSDWEAPWGWTYAPSLEAHWDGERRLRHLEGRLRDLHRPKPRSDDEASRERE